MNAKARRAIAGGIYLMELVWEIYRDVRIGLFEFYIYRMPTLARLFSRWPRMLLPLVCVAALCVLWAMTVSGRVRHFVKLVCTLLVAARLALPFLPVRFLPTPEPDLYRIPAALGVAGMLAASFVLLRKAGLRVKLSDEKGGGYYEDLYRQGVISLEEYEEMTRDR